MSTKTKVIISYILIFGVILCSSIVVYFNFKDVTEKLDGEKKIIATLKEEKSQKESRITELNNTINKNSEQIKFMNDYIVIIGNSNSYYHKYGCKNLDTSSFKCYNFNTAISLGFEPCPICIPENNKTYNEDNVSTSYIVYVTKSGSKYHSYNCSYLRSSKIAKSLKDAILEGYTPCSRCNP